MILRHRDTEVLRFEWLEPQGVRILSTNDAARRFLPLDMHGEATDDALWRWIRHRAVPRNRRNVYDLLARLGLDPNQPRGIIEICKGLSLNDVYWVVSDDFDGRWKDFNLYENDFSEVVASIAFTGLGPGVPGGWTSSPELTTNGMLAKCWRRRNGVVELFKSGTEGAVNTGFEPYSEFYAAQLAAAMGLPHVDYGLAMFKGRLCSTCPLFTSDKYGYLAAGRLISREEALADSRFAPIFLFDAIICNTDRHLGNFGYLVDNDTNEIVGAAPIFDNGCGLYSLATWRPGDSYHEFGDLHKFVSRVSPALYAHWLDFPGGLTDEFKTLVKRLRGFRFKRHKRYNLSAERLEIIEDFTQKRISEIIDNEAKADCSIAISQGDCTIKTKNENHVALKNDGLVGAAIKANLKADPFITKEELAEILGVAPRTVMTHLKALREAGEVRRVGSRKTGHWEVVEKQEGV